MHDKSVPVALLFSLLNVDVLRGRPIVQNVPLQWVKAGCTIDPHLKSLYLQSLLVAAAYHKYCTFHLDLLSRCKLIGLIGHCFSIALLTHNAF